MKNNKKQQKAVIKTFGCQMNEHDSERISGLLIDCGYELVEDTDDADLLVFNTCSIREKAEQKVFSEIGMLVRRYQKKRPKLRIAFCGCIAQREGAAIFKRCPRVNLVFGTGNIHRLPDLLKRLDNEGGKVVDVDRGEEGRAEECGPIKRQSDLKAFVKIMEGCDNFCTYCVVPFVRGREHSRSSKIIVDEITDLVEKGYKDFTLLGQNVNSYGRGLGENITFAGLLKKIDGIRGISWVRFVTSHPRDISIEVMEAIRDLGSVCEHLHLPVQAGSNKILNLMNRGYTREEYLEKVHKLRSLIPEISITSDVIVGFPGEDDKDFEETISLLKEAQFDGIFSFKYSKRPQTAALKLPNHLDDEVKVERLALVNSVQEEICLRRNEGLIGKEVEVLVEGESKTNPEMLTGRTRTNKIVHFMGDRNSLRGKVVPLRISKASKYNLEAVSDIDLY